MDPYAQALIDYYEEKETAPLLLHNSYGDIEEMPLWYFFREFDEMPELEKMALSVCEGQVLDVGAGTGCHSICLQQMGHDVTAIDTNQGAVTIMKASNVKQVRKKNYFDLEIKHSFDTILCLMNGIGFIGKLERFESFLNQADKLLRPDGQIIFDSSDVKYLYDGNDLPTHYYGEVSFQYEYNGVKGEAFDWLYIDPETLQKKADMYGWHTYILHSDENDQFLARLVRK